jgi:predicted site-specific integrase-resolvase
MREKFPNAEIVKDIGSGLNFKRKGLRTLLDRLSQGTKLTIVVAHKDRLARFGFELIEYLVNKNGGEILVLDKVSFSPHRELVEDILSILTVFSCRMHGLRRYHTEIQEDPNIPKSGTETDIP